MALTPTGSHSGSAIGAVLYDNTLAADTATLDTGAAGIASGYHKISIEAYVRTDEAVTSSALNMTFNGDSGANYSYQYLLGANVTAQAGKVTGAAAFAPDAAGASLTAGYFFYIKAEVFNYDTTAGFKPVWLQLIEPSSTATSMAVFLQSGIYLSSSAISRATFSIVTAAKKFKTGSRLTVLAW